MSIIVKLNTNRSSVNLYVVKVVQGFPTAKVYHLLRMPLLNIVSLPQCKLCLKLRLFNSDVLLIEKKKYFVVLLGYVISIGKSWVEILIFLIKEL